MIPSVELFDSHTIDSIHPPADARARSALGYLAPMIREGPLTYIDNADVRMFVLTVDGSVMPVVVSDEKSENADVCSPYSHYVAYPLHEMAKRGRATEQLIVRPLVRLTGVGLKAAHLDKVVYVNNWLFATNPCPDLSPRQIGAITTFLVSRFPEHAIVFRTVNKRTHKGYSDALLKNRYKMVASRKVYLVDAIDNANPRHGNAIRDRNLLGSSGYGVVTEFTEADIARITSVYRGLYLRKHVHLNPQFNERFFSLAISADLFEFRGLRKNGRIDSFVAYYCQDGVMTGAVVGYDIDAPSKLGLYRLAFALLMAEAREKGKLLNLSAGAGSFKVHRGATPEVEYDAVYDRHLPYHRRLAWQCLWAGGISQSNRLSRST